MQALKSLAPESVAAILKAGTMPWDDCGRPITAAIRVLALPDVFIDVWLRCFSHRLDLRESEEHLSLSQLMTLITVLPAHQHISVLHIQVAHLTENELLCFLKAFERASENMQQLEVLGLFGLDMHSEHVQTLACIFSNLRGAVKALRLSLRAGIACGCKGHNVFHECNCGLREKDLEKRLLFFQAIGRLGSLKVLMFLQCFKLFKYTMFSTMLAPLDKLGDVRLRVSGFWPLQEDEMHRMLPNLIFEGQYNGSSYPE